MNARKLLSAAKAVEAAYIEDVFSTYLYTGNGSTQTITNGIDLSGKGGLVWIKRRDLTIAHGLWDTARGAGTGTSNATNKALASNLTDAQGLGSTYPGEDLDYVNAFNANGFSLTTAAGGRNLANGSGGTYVSWAFRKQAKFFDVVTWSGNGSAQTLNHSLSSVPGVMIVKDTNGTGNWGVYHRSLGNAQWIKLNATDAAAAASASFWNLTTPTASTFTVGTGFSNIGVNYVAYLFAHDAGGFGASGSDNVISCGSYTGNGVTGLAVTLGYEPQWVMVKCSSAAQADGWIMVDNMRGMDNSANAWLKANTSGAETAESPRIVPTATGFTLSSNAAVNTNAATYIYIAIRRGPMKTPTTGTSVFSPNAYISSGSGLVTTGFPVDLQISTPGRTGLAGHLFLDRLRGVSTTSTESGQSLDSTSTRAEDTRSATNNWGSTGYVQVSGYATASMIDWNLRRAPGFFDEVCGTSANGTNDRYSHNLTVAPELIICKPRSVSSGWGVYVASLGRSSYMQVNQTTGATSLSNIWGTTDPTTTDFGINNSGTGWGHGSATLVFYLFATCPGVSKVFSYTGNGSSQTINCGFTGGARFVLIKRTDSTGNWTVFDSARGIVAGNDPALYLNSTAAEVTTIDAVDTENTGFIVNQDATLNLNVNAATYIGLAIA